MSVARPAENLVCPLGLPVASTSCGSRGRLIGPGYGRVARCDVAERRLRARRLAGMDQGEMPSDGSHAGAAQKVDCAVIVKPLFPVFGFPGRNRRRQTTLAVRDRRRSPAVSANGSPQGAEIPSRRKVRQVKNLSILQGETVLPTYDFRYASRWTGTLLECRQENARLPLNVYFSHKYNIALLEASVFLVLRFCPGERPITKTIHSPHRARNRLASHFDSAMRRGSALSGGRGDGCHLECVLTQCVFDANAPPEPILLCTKKKFSPSILTGRKRRKPIEAFINMILTR